MGAYLVCGICENNSKVVSSLMGNIVRDTVGEISDKHRDWEYDERFE